MSERVKTDEAHIQNHDLQRPVPEQSNFENRDELGEINIDMEGRRQDID